MHDQRLSDHIDGGIDVRRALEQSNDALGRLLALRRDGATHAVWLNALDTLHDRLLALADVLRPQPAEDWTRVPLEHQQPISDERLTWRQVAGWYLADAAAMVLDAHQRPPGPLATDDDASTMRPLETARHALETARHALDAHGGA